MMEEEPIGDLLKEDYLADKPRWNVLISLLEFVAIESIPDDDTQAYIILPLVKTKREHTPEAFIEAQAAVQEYLNPDIKD